MSASEPEELLIPDAEALHRELFDATANGDWDKIRTLYHDDYTYRGPDGVEREGPEAALRLAEVNMTAFPDLKVDVRHWLSPSPDISVMESTITGTHEADLPSIPATGKRVEFVYCNIVEVKDGQIIRERDYWDSASIRRQLGAR